MRASFILGVLLLAGLAVPAQACSVEEGYRVPGNIELIEKADLVVLATVVSGPETFDDVIGEEGPAPRVVLRPIRALKGEAPAELRVFGYFRLGDEAFPVFPTRLDQTHPTTMMGACIRQGYAKGATVLAMFRRTPEGYVQLDDPFARAVEDVAGPDDLWVRAAEKYVEWLATPDPRAVLETQRQELLAASDADSQAMAGDIDRYFKAAAGDE